MVATSKNLNFSFIEEDGVTVDGRSVLVHIQMLVVLSIGCHWWC